VEALCRTGCIEAAWDVIEEMELKHEIKPTATIFAHLIGACARHGRIDKAEDLYRDLLNRRLSPTPYAYAMLIKAVGRGEEPSRAFGYLYMMRKKSEAAKLEEETKPVLDMPPNTSVYSAVLDVCRRHGLRKRALELFSRGVKEDKLDIDLHLMDSAVKALTGDTMGPYKPKDPTGQNLSRMCEIVSERHPGDLMEMNTSLLANAWKGDFETCKKIWGRMESMALEPDHLTLHALSLWFLRAERFPKLASTLLSFAEKYEINPHSTTLALIYDHLDAYDQAGYQESTSSGECRMDSPAHSKDESKNGFDPAQSLRKYLEVKGGSCRASCHFYNIGKKETFYNGKDERMELKALRHLPVSWDSTEEDGQLRGPPIIFSNRELGTDVAEEIRNRGAIVHVYTPNEVHEFGEPEPH